MLRRAGVVTAGVVTAVEATRFATFERSEWHSTSSAMQQFATFEALRVASHAARYVHDRDCCSFAAVQAEVLRTRLKENESTIFGQDRGFTEILAASRHPPPGTGEDAALVNAFRTMHPITTPETYKPYIDQIARGDAAVMNTERETMLLSLIHI